MVGKKRPRLIIVMAIGLKQGDLISGNLLPHQIAVDNVWWLLTVANKTDQLPPLLGWFLFVNSAWGEGKCQ